MFLSDYNRILLHKFSLWLIMLLNHLDSKTSDLTYILPEICAQIPFEIFRAYKRGNVPLHETENDITFDQQEYNEVYKGIFKNTTLARELVKFISRHFYDAKIANPDSKEIYLTRLNMLL